MIKLLLVEDQLVTLEMLNNSIKQCEDIDIVGSITTADMAVAACAKLQPNIVLMDILTKSSLNGIQATKAIKEQYPHIKVMLITGFDELHYPKQAAEAGADAFLSKNISIAQLIDSIHKIMEGQHIFQTVTEDINLGPANAKLTSRELDVLRLLCEGKTRNEIATVLKVTNNTINFHINNMLLKSGCSNIISLATEAVAKGYIINL